MSESHALQGRRHKLEAGCRRVSDKALKALRRTLKEKTRRTLGVSLCSLMSGLSKTLLGWRSYYCLSEVPIPLQELEK